MESTRDLTAPLLSPHSFGEAVGASHSDAGNASFGAFHSASVAEPCQCFPW